MDGTPTPGMSFNVEAINVGRISAQEVSLIFLHIHLKTLDPEKIFKGANFIPDLQESVCFFLLRP